MRSFVVTAKAGHDHRDQLDTGDANELEVGV